MKKLLCIIIFFLTFLSSSVFAQSYATSFSLSSEINNLFYSKKTDSFYYSIVSENQNIEGFYIYSQQEQVLKRLFCPSCEFIMEKAEALIKDTEKPDYEAFFSFLYSFADNGTDPVFAYKDFDGSWLFEEAALEKFYENRGWTDDFAEPFYNNATPEGRFRLERVLFDKNKGFENPETAFSYNGYPELLNNIRINKVQEGFFIENDAGIYYMEKKQDGSGRLCIFLDSDNSLEYIVVSELNGVVLKYDPSILQTRKNSFVFTTLDSECVYYNCTTGEVSTFLDEASLNKYLKKIDVESQPEFVMLKLIAFIFAAVSIILVLLIIISKIVYRINQANPAKRKYTFTQKEFNQKIFAVQENERKKISRDIHDTVIQDIRVLGLESDLIKLTPEDTQNNEHKKKIQQISTDCIIKLRNICYNLAPAELSGHTDDDSSKIQLVSMLNTLSTQFTIRTHIPCCVKVKDDFNYPPFEHSVTENLFRVVQEALTNIEKHSYATSVSIFIKSKIKAEKEYMIIYISDDGVGCDTKQLNLKNDQHRGLRNMKERMELIGGQIDFFSKPNEGLEITLTVAVPAVPTVPEPVEGVEGQSKGVL